MAVRGLEPSVGSKKTGGPEFSMLWLRKDPSSAIRGKKGSASAERVLPACCSQPCQTSRSPAFPTTCVPFPLEFGPPRLACGSFDQLQFQSSERQTQNRHGPEASSLRSRSIAPEIHGSTHNSLYSGVPRQLPSIIPGFSKKNWWLERCEPFQ